MTKSTSLSWIAAALASCICAAPVAAQDIIPPKAFVSTPGGINVSEGSIAYGETDLATGPLTLERFMRSGNRQANNPAFGTNFSSNFDIYVARKKPSTGANYLTVHIGNSASGIYTQSKTNPYSINADNVDAFKGLLSWNGSQYVYIDASGTIYTFSATYVATGLPAQTDSQKIERIDFPGGRRQTFSYNTSGYLKLVEDSSGHAMVFDYDANGDVTAACAFNRTQSYVSAASTCSGAARKTTYGYTSGMLTSVVDVLGKTTNYTNSSTGVTCIRPPGYATCKITQVNGGPRLVANSNMGASQTMADGAVWSVSASDNAGPVMKGDPYEATPYDGHLEAYVTDPDNKVTYLTFTMTSPYSMTDPNGRVTQFRYEGGVSMTIPGGGGQSYGSMLKEATYPEGNKYQAEYVGPFRAVTKETFVPKPGSGQPNLIKTYGYSPTYCGAPATYQNCAKPIWIKDPAGNQTDMTYASHGGVLTEMGPAPTAGSARPLKLVTYAQRYAWIKNSGGTLVQASLPVWVVATETLCQTAAGSSTPACDGAAQQTLTTYEFGAAGTAESLLVKGVAVSSGGITLRSCSTYDSWQRKISETQPNANLGSCP